MRIDIHEYGNGYRPTAIGIVGGRAFSFRSTAGDWVFLVATAAATAESELWWHSLDDEVDFRASGSGAPVFHVESVPRFLEAFGATWYTSGCRMTHWSWLSRTRRRKRSRFSNGGREIRSLHLGTSATRRRPEVGASPDPDVISGRELAELLRDKPWLLRLEVDEGREVDSGRSRWVVHADGRLVLDTFQPVMGGGAMPGSSRCARMTSAQAVALFRTAYNAGLTRERDEEWEGDPTGSFDTCILGVAFCMGERSLRASVVGPRSAPLVQLAMRVGEEFETRGIAVPVATRLAWTQNTTAPRL